MKLSLQTRVSIFITLIIVATSAVSTYFYTTAHRQSRERGRISRGMALSYALSHAAEEGIITESLDLLKKASHIIQAPDVTLAQVYSNIWEALDAYPLDRLKEQPLPDAVNHFRNSDAPLYLKTESGYDFYTPIFFKASDNTPPVIVGFARIILSSAGIKEEIRQMILTSIAVSAVITLLAIISLNVLMGRLVVKPVMNLHKSVSLFKNGTMPEITRTQDVSSDELRELSLEFNGMCRTIKEKEEKLIESDRRIRSLFDRVEHAIFRLDGKGTIVEANNRFKTLFGGNVTQLCEILLGQDDAAECLAKAASQKGGLHIEEKAVGKKGEELIVSLSLYPETDIDGAISGFDGYIIDVTEKKRLEERLMRAQKMEAVGTLAGGMAHDFNNLLTAILGYAEIILMKTKEGDPFHKPATIIYEAAKRGADFGKRILSITRKEKLETKSVGINDIVRSSMELLLRSIPKNIDIVTNLREDIPQIKADPSQMQQVIMNLAVNARDAMPAGGRLLIETSVVGRERGADSATRSGGEFVKLSISDTGIGIDKKTQGRIFDPFFTTKDMGRGTGLGLYIVHSIVSNHGGFINLYSESSKGTQFNIYFPVVKGENNEDERVAEDIKGTGTILVIDDESDVRDLCKDMLEPLGYSVMLEGSGNSGIRTFREMKEQISLVILDMIMPGMGGGEVYQALKTIKPGIKVLLCSGYSQNGFAGIDDLMSQGASGFVQKPFSRQTLALAIKKALTK